MIKKVETKRDWRSYWAEAVSRTGPEEFAAQVGYTISGQPLDAVHHDMIEQAVRENLAIVSSDCVLDLCCGNGIVTKRIAALARHIYGVDFSPALIEVARQHFSGSDITYICRSATELGSVDVRGDRITKVYMLAALQYFTEETVPTLMSTIGELSGGKAPVYFTDIPDIDHLWDFYNTAERRAEYQRRRAAGTEAIGTWWSKQTLTELLERSGYTVHIVLQDMARFGAHYRFDLLARPR
jgi:cyclopropane fatty-acyl-phospholipid synthase-like methyltransferase